jgi:hypothetical protein
MNEDFSKCEEYKVIIDEIVNKDGFKYYDKCFSPSRRLYSLYYKKNNDSCDKTLEIGISEEFVEDKRKDYIERIKSQLIHGLKSYNPEPSYDNSFHSILIKN